MKKIIFTILLLLAFAPITNAVTGSEVNINKDGNATISSVRVMQIFGTTLAVRLYWGDAYVRLTVKTGANTKFYRGTGEQTVLKEMAVGDVLDVTGVLEPGSDTLTVLAATVRNSSVQKKQTTLSGKVIGVDLSGRKFGMDSKTYGPVTVVATSTTIFTKGNRTLDLEHVKIGDTITKVIGDYDLVTKTLVAQSVVTYVNLNNYKPANYEGKLQGITGTTAPTTIKVLINGVSYTVNLSAKTSIFNKNKNSVLLSRFVAGDTIRIFGAVQEVDDPIINADIVRNMSL